MCDINNYQYYKQHHICVNCGQEFAEKNHILCLQCMIKSRERALSYYNEHKKEIREKKRIKNKDRYNKLKELKITKYIVIFVHLKKMKEKEKNICYMFMKQKI